MTGLSHNIPTLTLLREEDLKYERHYHPRCCGVGAHPHHNNGMMLRESMEVMRFCTFIELPHAACSVALRKVAVASLSQLRSQACSCPEESEKRQCCCRLTRHAHTSYTPYIQKCWQQHADRLLLITKPRRVPPTRNRTNAVDAEIQSCVL
eukprot:6204473-Pleurochrysis_carterae.AAC.2